MHVIALISQKGGAGKSTLARQLAWFASRNLLDYPRAVLVDRDPQQTTTSWWKRRQTGAMPPTQPELLEVGPNTLPAALEALRQQDPPACVLIDTRPAITELEAESARLADQIIVPVRPSADDIEAVRDTLAMLRRLNALQRTVIVVNAAKSPQRGQAGVVALARWPVSICPTVIRDRTAYQDAALLGLSVAELGAPGQAAADEMEAVWRWLHLGAQQELA